MSIAEAVYVGSTVGLIGAALFVVAVALTAYRRMARRAFVDLAVGFALIAAASVTTLVTTTVFGFRETLVLMVVDHGLTLLGYVFLVYSVLLYVEGEGLATWMGASVRRAVRSFPLRVSVEVKDPSDRGD